MLPKTQEDLFKGEPGTRDYDVFELEIGKDHKNIGERMPWPKRWLQSDPSCDLAINPVPLS